MGPQNKNHRYKEQVADELRETNEKLIKRLAGHRLTEQALRKDAQTFRAIADTLPVGISLAEDRKLTWANPAFMKIHGFESPNDYFGQSTEILFASSDEFERAGRIVYSGLEAGNIVEITAKQKRQDGSVFDAHLRLAAFGASDPAKRIVICCTTDMSEQIEAEDRLRRSEERYRTSLEESFDGALIVKGSQILLANSRLGEMLGYSKEELEGMEYLTIVHPDYRELIINKATAPISGEDLPPHYEMKLFRKDGACVDVEVNGRVIEIEGEAFIQVWIRDVSERKRAEENLSRSEERYRALVEQSFDGVSIHDGKKVLFANSRFCEMLGYGKEELEGMDIGLTVHPDHRQLVKNRIIGRMHGEDVPSLYELKLRRKDGAAVEVETNARAVVLEGRQVVQSWVRDVSERKRAEDTVRQSEERYRTLVEQSFDGIMIHDGTKIAFVNSRLCEMLGYQRDELEGMDHWLTVHPDYRDLVHDRALDRARGESVPPHYEVKFQCKDGSVFDGEICARAIEIQGAPGVQVWIRDITERKRAEEALRVSEERLSTAVKMAHLGHWEYDVAKDLFTFNDHFYQLFRTTVEQVGGYTMSSADYARRFLHPDDLAVVGREIRKSIETADSHSSQQLDHRILYADGEVGYISVRIFVVKNELGRTVKTYGVNQDITERKRAEEEARQSEERYRTLVEESFDGIMIHNGAKVVFANSRLCEMLGYQKEELEGMELRMTLHPDYREMVTERAAARARGENVPSHYEVKQLRKDGTSLDTEINARLIDVGGEKVSQIWIRDISEQKEAQEALRRTEERYRTLVEEAFDGIMIHDGTRVLFANSRLCEMIGFTKEEVIGQRFWGAVETDDQRLVTDMAAARLRGEAVPTHYEIKSRRKDGSVFDAEITARMIEMQGKPAAQVWMRDISEGKKAEEALRRSEANYRAIFESMNDAIFIHDVETGALLDANRKMSEMYGYSRDEVSRLRLRDMSAYDEQFSDEQGRQRLRLAAKGEPQVFEWHAKNKDGQHFWVEVNLKQAILNDRRCLLAVVRDITDRKSAEQERENERLKFRALVDGSPFGIIMVRKDNTYEYVNPKFTEIFGYVLKDIPDGKHWMEKSWPDPEDRREMIAAWYADLVDLERGMIKVRTSAVTCADGTKKMVTLRTAQLHTGEFIITCEDITDQVRGEQERENLRHQLLHAQKIEALGTLVGGVAHDFNNLLTIILGYSELLLLDKGEDDPGAADLKKVVEAASSGAALVQRMLTFSEQTDTRLGPLNLNREIENMKELLSRTVPKMISFDLRLSEDLALIDGDTGQIQQAIMNLALNAVEAMPDGGKLTIETKNVILDHAYGKTHSGIKPGDYVLLAVSDTGHGIDEKTMERMYDPFFTTKNRDFTKGTGLGLAIVHGIVQGHGGQILCSSEPEKGTRFELYFPALSYEELISEESAKDPTGAAPSARGAETILLVDDEEMVRDLGARILKKAGYKTLTANNGKEGLAVYKKRMAKIALVILDLIMPEMGGEQCLEEILKIDPRAKVLISTGYSSSDEMTRIRTEALASGFVAKPFALSDMLKTVRKILDGD